jgi:hypothetical protein
MSRTLNSTELWRGSACRIIHHFQLKIPEKSRSRKVRLLVVLQTFEQHFQKYAVVWYFRKVATRQGLATSTGLRADVLSAIPSQFRILGIGVFFCLI